MPRPVGNDTPPEFQVAADLMLSAGAQPFSVAATCSALARGGVAIPILRGMDLTATRSFKLGCFVSERRNWAYDVPSDKYVDVEIPAGAMLRVAGVSARSLVKVYLFSMSSRGELQKALTLDDVPYWEIYAAPLELRPTPGFEWDLLFACGARTPFDWIVGGRLGTVTPLSGAAMQALKNTLRKNPELVGEPQWDFIVRGFEKGAAVGLAPKFSYTGRSDAGSVTVSGNKLGARGGTFALESVIGVGVWKE